MCAAAFLLALLSACQYQEVQPPLTRQGEPIAIEHHGGQIPTNGQTILAGSRAVVIDGDTLGVDGLATRVRLYGIDAPEGKQTCNDAAGRRYLCGPRAAEALAGIIGRNGRVTLDERDVDRYGRTVAVVYISGLDVGAELVRQGWALEYKTYSDGRYRAAEAEAKRAGRGLWAGAFVPPWEWRREQRRGRSSTMRLAHSSTVAHVGGTCSAVSNCEEAVALWCSGYSRADGDGDGVPCERVCKSASRARLIRLKLGC